MTESDQIVADARKLAAYSRQLREHSRQLCVRTEEQIAQIRQLEQRCRAAQAESQRLLRRAASAQGGDESGASHSRVY